MTTWRPSQQPVDREPRRIGESLERVAQRLGTPAPSVLSTVFEHWDEIVGPDIAAHAKPMSLRDGVLLIGVDQAAWATQLKYLGADLMKRVEERCGSREITSIDFRVEGAQPRRRRP